MKTKNIIVLLLMLVALAGICYGALPTLKWNLPSTSITSPVKGVTELNVTVNSDGTNYEVSNVTFFYSTDNTTWTLIGNETKSVPADNDNCTGFNRTWNTNSLDDTSLYYLRAKILNLSAGASVDYHYSYVYINNTLPVVSLTSPTELTQLEDGDILTFSSKNTTSCKLYMDNQPVITMTYASNQCTYTIDKFTLPDGSYNNVRVISSDLTSDTTTSSTYQFLVTNTKSNGLPLTTQSQTTGLKQTTSTTGGLNTFTIVALLIAAYVIFVHNKKR